MTNRTVLILFDETKLTQKDVDRLAPCCKSSVKTLLDIRKAIQANYIDCAKMHAALSQPAQKPAKAVKKTVKQEDKEKC